MARMGHENAQWPHDAQPSIVAASTLSTDEETLGLIRLLLARLERISADSVWAHRASGIRGSLLRMLDRVEDQQPVSDVEWQRLIQWGFDILRRAARK
jgi:hypothetical protein